MSGLLIPPGSLVVLIGAAGAGKSTFAARHFRRTEIVSSDFCRGLVCDDQSNQLASKDAFEVLHLIAAKRLARGRLTVVDATNVQPGARAPLLRLAREHGAVAVAILFNLPEEVCQQRDRLRSERAVGPAVVQQHCQELRRSLPVLEQEGFQYVYVLTTPEQMDTATIERQAPPEQRAPFENPGAG